MLNSPNVIKFFRNTTIKLTNYAILVIRNLINRREFFALIMTVERFLRLPLFTVKVTVEHVMNMLVTAISDAVRGDLCKSRKQKEQHSRILSNAEFPPSFSDDV